jgi:putative membrane protein
MAIPHAALLALLSAGAVATAHAEAQPSAIHLVGVSPAQAEGVLKHGGDVDRDFIEDGIRAGLAEIEASKLALQRSQRAEIKAFAQQMIDEHTKANQQLLAIAKNAGIKAPDGLSVHQKTRMQRLRGTTGTRFDKRYIDDYGVIAHEKTIGLVRRTLSETRNDSVRELASQLLPQLEHHIVMATEAQSAVESLAGGNRKREGEGGTTLPPPGDPSLQKPGGKAY